MITNDKVIEIYCATDEFSKKFDEEIEKMPLLSSDGKARRRRSATMSDSEIMAILIMFHFGTFDNFKHYYLHFIKVHLKSDFPDAVSYNRFVELEGRVFFKMMFFLNLHSFGRCTGITFVDSTMIPVCHTLRRYANKVFAGLATDGKGTMGWCHGFKLHFICNDRGEIIMFCLTGANVDDRDPRVWAVLGKKIYGKLFADRGYISPTLFDTLFAGRGASGNWHQEQHEEQTHAFVGQDYAQEEIRHRVYQPLAQRQGEPRALQTQVGWQLCHEPYCCAWSLLLLRQQT